MAEKVFVGGAIQYALGDEGFNQGLKDLIERTIKNVEDDGYDILSAHRYENYGEMNVTDREKWVTQRDYNWMKECDYYVAVLPEGPDGKPIRTDGTHIELGWAAAMEKPIVIVRSPEPTMQYSFLVAGLDAVADVQYITTEQLDDPNFKISDLLKKSADGNNNDDGGKLTDEAKVPPPSNNQATNGM